MKPGDKIKVWWYTGDDNWATIIKINKYTGKYTDAFNCILTLYAPNTEKGFLEMAYNSNEFNYE